jgi:hypothetical protein
VREVQFVNVGHAEQWGIALTTENNTALLLYATNNNLILFNRSTGTEIWRK